jgi:hypothetical protein
MNMASMASQGGTQARQMTRDEEKGKQEQAQACCSLLPLDTASSHHKRTCRAHCHVPDELPGPQDWQEQVHRPPGKPAAAAVCTLCHDLLSRHSCCILAATFTLNAACIQVTSVVAEHTLLAFTC